MRLHFICINKMLSYAEDDWLQMGMCGAFGKSLGTAVSLHSGQVIMSTLQQAIELEM